SAPLSDESFQAAQWAQGSAAATALAQMVARSATSDGDLGRLVRERQDLVGEWGVLDRARVTAVSEVPAKRDRATEATMAARLATIDTRLAAIDQQLARDFADYSALTNPQPITVEDARIQIKDNEALIVFLDTAELGPTPEETFIWVVTKTDTHW